MNSLRRHMLTTLAFGLVLVGFPGNCRAESWQVKCESWPEADQLFRRDTRWRGADAANSIDLGNGRVLWTFGDSFVDTHPDAAQRNRKRAKFIRNSVAIQQGYNPIHADFRAYWQVSEGGQLGSFFRDQEDEFFWPGGGVVLNEKVLIYLMRIRNSKARLGFSVTGWGAVLVENPHEEPSKWQMHFLTVPQNSLGVMVGSGSSVRQGDWIYSYGSDNSRRHQLYLTRVRVADVLKGDFSRLQWRNGLREDWIEQKEIDLRSPEPVMVDGQTEFTVHFDKKLDRFLLTQFKSFPQAPIMMRESRTIVGPWSEGQIVYRPEEAKLSMQDTMIYAAKAHPEQQVEGLAVTYCTNTYRLSTVRNRESVYYPRFVRMIITAQADTDAN